MSILSTTIFRHFCWILALLLTLVLQVAAYGQTVVHVDGDNGLAVPNLPDPGDSWGNAFKYLNDAIAFAKLNPGAEDLWVAATDPSNPYRPDRDAVTPGGTGNRDATFLLDFDNLQLLGGFFGNETDPDDRDPAMYETVLSGEVTHGACGDPGGGDCFLANGTPGCDDAECCETVCTVDPDCCEVVWDQACADLAFAVCGPCGDPEAGDCFVPNGTPGCDFVPCCQTVCTVDPDCCDVAWDQACADLAFAICGPCGNPGAGNCFVPNGTPGCDDAECCAAVCAGDPVCCLLDWDQTCVDITNNICSPPPGAGAQLQAYHVVTADGVNDSVRIDGFTITDGLAVAGASTGVGAGMVITNASLAVIRVTFTANAAPGHGGAMNISGTSDPLVVNCEFVENTGKEAGALHTEGGIAGGTFVNCLFIGNESEEQGGAINPGADGDLHFINCTFADNSVASAAGGGAIFTEGPGDGEVFLINCILWGNKAGVNASQINDNADEEVTVSYSDVEGTIEPSWDGGNNINDDPLFVDPVNGDYRLDDLSPCIDFGDTDSSIIPCDQFDLDNDDITCDAVDPDNNEATPDLDLLNRVTDGDGIDGDRVDMGAYEFCDPDGCPWDLDDGGFVGAGDLLLLLADWGNPYGASDLLDLLAAWGACPCFSVEPPTLAQELTAACLSNDDWQDFLDALDTGTTAEQVNYICWLTHYFEDCTRCICIGQSGCPDDDPFN